MKKLSLFLLLLLAAGCGGSSDIKGTSTGFDFDSTQGNFITTTVVVERKFLYLLNRGDNTLSAYLLDGEEEGHSHSHSHNRIVAQEIHEELSLTELDGSPYSLGSDTLVDMVVDPQGRYLVVLDQAGKLRSYSIEGLSGLVTLVDESGTAVANPRRLTRSYNGFEIAVLGDSASIHQVDNEGRFSTGATVDNTTGWSDLRVDGVNAVAATSEGAVGFQWSPGSRPGIFSSVALPGTTRGEVTYSQSGVWVLNRSDSSVSLIEQQPNAELSVLETFRLPPSLINPSLISALFEGEDLAVADADTLVILHAHDGEIEAEGEVELARAPNRIFGLPESEFVLLGHDSGVGSTLLHIVEGEPLEIEVHEKSGPGGVAPFGFGFSERIQTVTETRGF